MLRNFYPLWALACACAVLLASPSFGQTGTNTAARPAVPKAPPPPMSTDKYVFKPGDKVTLRVVESREDPVLLTVSQGGEIETPYLGRRLVMGRTIPQVEAELKADYEKEYYFHATVQISIESINPIVHERVVRRIYVTGQVPSQGAQDIPEGETYTVSRAILRAGGLASFANGRKVRVVRKGQDKKEDQITVDVLSILEDGKVENDVELQQDDLIIVPEKLINW